MIKLGHEGSSLVNDIKASLEEVLHSLTLFVLLSLPPCEYTVLISHTSS